MGWLESKSSTQPPDRQADSQSCPRPAWPRKKAVSRWGLGGSGYPASKHTPSRDLIGPPASARSLTRRSVPGGQRLLAPAHGHDHYEERIYGIDGALTWTVDGRQIEIGPGQALCIPRGPSTASITPGSQDVKALCVITPAALGPQYFRACAEVIDATAGGPPDLIRCPTDIPSTSSSSGHR